MKQYRLVIVDPDDHLKPIGEWSSYRNLASAIQSALLMGCTIKLETRTI